MKRVIAIKNYQLKDNLHLSQILEQLGFDGKQDPLSQEAIIALEKKFQKHSQLPPTGTISQKDINPLSEPINEEETEILPVDILQKIGYLGEDIFQIAREVTCRALSEGVRQGINEFNFNKEVEKYSLSDRKKKRDRAVESVLVEVFASPKKPTKSPLQG